MTGIFLRVIALMALIVEGGGGARAWAQEASELKARAENEIHQAGESKGRVTSAQLNAAMLSLKDPMPEVRGRSWDYFVSLDLQSFRPQGFGSNDLSEVRFSLDDLSSTLLPTFSLGFQNGILNRPQWTLRGGLGAKVGYTSQRGSARFPTGYVESDARLNTTLFSADPFVALTLSRWSNWSARLGAEVGHLDYIQSSANKLATFSEHAQYLGWNLGLEYAASAHTSVHLEYARRWAMGETAARLQADNLGMGAQVTW